MFFVPGPQQSVSHVISPASPDIDSDSTDMTQVLVRYGAIPQVARYDLGAVDATQLIRGAAVVVVTDRGEEIGELLEAVPGTLADGHDSSGSIARLASSDDQARHRMHQQEAELAYTEWHERILDWKLELELMDVERTLDGEKWILYVLNDRGAETTRLALLAAAAGLGIVSVQSVDAAGLAENGGGGCGSGGCGCSH